MTVRTGDHQADVIVVGAGSGGCTVARRLIDAGISVLLLEAGGPDINPAIHDPQGFFELLGSSEDYAYETVPQPNCAGRRIPQPRGRVVGGSSSINGMIYARGAAADFDAWAYEGNDGWGFDDVLPLFRRSEDFDGGESEYRGVGGPLPVMGDYEPHPALSAVLDAAVQAGLPRNPDYNAESLDGASVIQLNVRDGRRMSAAASFLAPVMDSDRLTLLTGCQVLHLIIEGGRCAGVEFSRDGTIERALASHQVVLAAGVIDSPKLLLLSGIGPAGDLAKLGIDSVVDVPGVGENLHDHFYAPLSFAAAKPVPPAIEGLTQFHAHYFWRSRSGLPCPDIQALIVHLPINLDSQADPGHGISPTPMLVRPASRGNLRLASADPSAAPLIDPRYFSAQIDVETLCDGIEFGREVARQDALAEWVESELLPGPGVKSRQELREYVRQTATSNWHPVGTCKMGVDELAVVDPQLRVYGIEGLRVADGSVMPNITTANTHAPTVMLAERASDLIKAELGVTAGAAEVPG